MSLVKYNIMYKFITKLVLFLSSYCFLYLLITIRNYNNEYIFYSGIFLIAISIVLVLNIVKQSQKRADEIIVIKSFENENSNNLTYLLTYIIPFLAISITNWNDIIIQIVLFIFIGFLYMNSNMLQINPTLNLLGYKLYKIVDIDNNRYFLITKNKVFIKKKLKVYKEDNMVIN